MTKHYLVFLCAALFIFAGCPGDDDDDATGDDDTGDDDTGDDDTGDDDTGDDDDANNSCAEAVPMPMDGDWLMDLLDDPDDEDFFSFTLDEDSFVNLWTGFYDDAVDGQLDPVISLYTEDGGTLLATADDQIPRVNTDSELRYHAAAGTYCVKMESWDHWSGETASAETIDWSYALNALVMDPDSDLWYEGVLNPDTEPNDDADQAQAGTMYEGTGGIYGTVYGVLETADDVDVYAFTLDEDATYINVYFYRPTGAGGQNVQGHGTTLELGRVEISDPEGNFIARADGTLDMEAISLPFEGGIDVLLWVRAPDGWTSGENDFYVIDLYNAYESNPFEDEVGGGANDSIPTAESTSFSGGSTYLAGALHNPIDIDFWEFSSDADQDYALACAARRNGSGLVDATFAILDAQMNVLQTETETAEADVLWTDNTYSDASMSAVQITDAGDYYLSISTAGQDPEVSSGAYMCGLHNVTP